MRKAQTSTFSLEMGLFTTISVFDTNAHEMLLRYNISK